MFVHRIRFMMKIVYLILAHKNIHQLIRLVERINSEDSLTYIHIDRKAKHFPINDLKKQIHRYDNVCMTRRYGVNWGYAHIPVYRIIQYIHSRKVDFDYAILLSGQDYPLKSQRTIISILQKHYPHELLEYHPLPCDDLGVEECASRIEKWHFSVFNRVFTFPPSSPNIRWWKKIGIFAMSMLLNEKRKLPDNYEPHIGSAWWCLTRDAISYLSKFLASRQGKRFINFFYYTHIPDESFFQTLLLNSPIRDRIHADNLRYIRFKTGSSHPDILTKNDYYDLVSSDKLFARKFDTAVDEEVLDMLDQHIDNDESIHKNPQNLPDDKYHIQPP